MLEDLDIGEKIKIYFNADVIAKQLDDAIAESSSSSGSSSSSNSNSSSNSSSHERVTVGSAFKNTVGYNKLINTLSIKQPDNLKSFGVALGVAGIIATLALLSKRSRK